MGMGRVLREKRRSVTDPPSQCHQPYPNEACFAHIRHLPTPFSPPPPPTVCRGSHPPPGQPASPPSLGVPEAYLFPSIPSSITHHLFPFHTRDSKTCAASSAAWPGRSLGPAPPRPCRPRPWLQPGLLRRARYVRQGGDVWVWVWGGRWKFTRSRSNQTKPTETNAAAAADHATVPGHPVQTAKTKAGRQQAPALRPLHPRRPPGQDAQGPALRARRRPGV